MPPRLIQTITVIRPDEHWETKATDGPHMSSSRSAPCGDSARWQNRQTGPSLSPPDCYTASADIFESKKSRAVREASAPSTRASTIKGHPISTSRAKRTPSIASSPANIYGVVPNRPIPRALTGFQTQYQSATSTSTPPRGTAHPLRDPLPELPPWFAYLLFGFLVLGFAAAALLYFVNFPPASRRRHGYIRVENEHMELEILNSAGFSSSADTPTVTFSARKKRDMSIDSSIAQSIGLGTTPELRKRRSFDNRLSLRSPLLHSPAATSPALTPTLPYLTSPSIHDDVSDRPKSRRRQPDLEDGLLRPDFRQRNDSPTSTSSSRSSSRVRLLEKIGDGVEFATDYLAKMMHDQVRDDPEEGLLLPIRDSDREFASLENGKLKKVC